jgi:hypothetical protein
MDNNSNGEYLANFSPIKILLSFRFDTTNVFQIIPPEIIYLIVEYYHILTNIIEFEFSHHADPNFEKIHQGRKLPYSIQTLEMIQEMHCQPKSIHYILIFLIFD